MELPANHSCASPYLTTNTDNPTRYQLLIPGYNTPDQFPPLRQL